MIGTEVYWYIRKGPITILAHILHLGGLKGSKNPIIGAIFVKNKGTFSLIIFLKHTTP